MDDLVGCSEMIGDRRGAAVSGPAPELRPVAGLLTGKVALVTGGDTTLGRAAALLFARQGADIAFTHRVGHELADDLVRAIEREGRACLALRGDLGDPNFCDEIVRRVVDRFGGIDVLVNNLDGRHSRSSFFPLFYLTRRLLPFLRRRPGANIINAAPRAPGAARQPDPTALAVDVVTRSLAHNLESADIHVRAVAPELTAAEDGAAADLLFLASVETALGDLGAAETPAADERDLGAAEAPAADERDPRSERPGPEEPAIGGPPVRRRRRPRR
ncbi:MAG TPA: SDR family NAD(P)-dependent oxidoreductase [Nannocystis sp.]